MQNHWCSSEHGYLACWINHQSQSVTQVPVIYHLGYILIALWHNRYAPEIRFTVELQFCQKLYRDHLCSPSSGEYFIILLDLLTIRPWRDRACFVLICFCHSVFLGISSPGLIYIYIFGMQTLCSLSEHGYLACTLGSLSEHGYRTCRINAAWANIAIA